MAQAARICPGEKWLRPIFTRMLEIYGGDTDAALTMGIPPESGLSHFDYFAAFIALAISSITLTWKNETQARTASDAFFEVSLQHLRLILGATEVQRLQISLLLAHYAHMSPAKVDNWACIWNATRVVLELGLHKRSSEKPSHEQAGLRNQLFWVLYGMERSICTLLKLPLTFTEESITASLYLPSCATSEDETKKQSSASHLYRLRALETEVYRVLHLQDTQAQGQHTDLDSWIENITSRLDEWLETAEGFSKYQIFEFRMVQYSCLRARIYRPTPRLEARTPQARQACFDACSTIVEDYQQQAKRRRLFYPWHAVHILYEAAIIMLEACWALRDHVPSRQTARHILAVTIPDCLMLLSKVGQSWEDAAICAKYLIPIVNEVTVAFGDRVMTSAASPRKVSEMETTEKLHRLLFPEGLPAWGTPMATTESVTTDNEAPAPLLGDITMAGGEEFDWPSDWNFLQDLSPSFRRNSPWTG
ncbi:Pyrimidine pathway regulatory protein 1 [Cytospora mali]|uniref:Pyrimidine pathway regulatory protein 1 n=1 Tax=Cytospora mali TaxID=578113 RepID=A0A194W7A2_CYTMA|nr:Pyrimidine pathway regulatory protein 1 [Valsa mali]